MRRLESIPEPNDRTPDAQPGRRWLLHGDRGTVHFCVWDVPPHPLLFPDGKMPADLGYHSHTPLFAGQEIMEPACPFLDGQPCYYDGSMGAAVRVWAAYQTGGDQVVFAYLDKYYESTFGEPAV